MERPADCTLRKGIWKNNNVLRYNENVHDAVGEYQHSLRTANRRTRIVLGRIYIRLSRSCRSFCENKAIILYDRILMRVSAVLAPTLWSKQRRRCVPLIDSADFRKSALIAAAVRLLPRAAAWQYTGWRTICTGFGCWKIKMTNCTLDPHRRLCERRNLDRGSEPSYR